MGVLANGLTEANHDEDALNVEEAELAMLRRLGADEDDLLTVRGNLAATYTSLGRHEEALRTERDVYSGRLKLYGEEHEHTLRAASNYAISLLDLRRFKEAKRVLRKVLPVARRVVGTEHNDAVDRPTTEVLVEGRGVEEHSVHRRHAGDIPRADFVVEGRRARFVM